MRPKKPPGVGRGGPRTMKKPFTLPEVGTAAGDDGEECYSLLSFPPSQIRIY